MCAADVKTIFQIASDGIKSITQQTISENGTITSSLNTTEKAISHMINGVAKDIREREAQIGRDAAAGDRAAVKNDLHVIQDLLSDEQQLAIYAEETAKAGVIALTADGKGLRDSDKAILDAALKSIKSGNLQIFQATVDGIKQRSFRTTDARVQGLQGHYSNILDSAQQVKDKADAEEQSGNPGNGGGTTTATGDYQGTDTFGNQWDINLRTGNIRILNGQNSNYSETVTVTKNGDGFTLKVVKSSRTLLINGNEAEADTLTITPIGDGSTATIGINFDQGSTTTFTGNKVN
jgi:hypothetical protein